MEEIEATAPGATRPYVPLAVRVLDATRLSPGLAAFALFLAVQIAFFAWMNAIDFLQGFRHHGAIVLRYRLYWFEGLSALLVALAALRLRVAPGAAARRVAELRPVLGGAPVDLAPPRLLLRALALAGVALALVFTRWISAAMRAAGEDWPGGVELWVLLRNALVFGTVFQCAAYDLHLARGFARAGRAVREADLLDPAPFQPFGRQALQGALLWIALTSLVAFFLFDDLARPWTVSFLAVLAALSLALLVIPASGVRARVRAAKAEEARRVRALLRRARDESLAPGAAKDEGPVRLGALASYLQLVESAREWPFDAPTLVRIGLTLALPLGSWLGGALVERIVGWALGG